MGVQKGGQNFIANENKTIFSIELPDKINFLPARKAAIETEIPKTIIVVGTRREHDLVARSGNNNV